MSSFSIDFPDETILNSLGDDIIVSDKSGNDTMIKAAFEYRFLDDAMADVGINYPILEIEKHHSILFHNGFLVTFNNNKYRVLRVIAGQVEKSIVVLRNSYGD